MWYHTNIFRSQSEASGLDPATQALLDQAAIDGYSPANTVVRAALDTLIKTFKADSVWDLLDVFYVFATNGDRDFAKYNIKDPTQFFCTEVNSPTYTSLEGFTAGASSYLSTGWDPSTNGVNYTLNSCGLGAYVRNQVLSGNSLIMGSRVAANSYARLLTISGDYASGINQDTSRIQTIINAPGLIQANRTASNAHELKINSLTEDTSSQVSGVLSTADFYICGFNSNTILDPGFHQVSFAYMGADLSGNYTEIYNAIQTYMTALGTQV